MELSALARPATVLPPGTPLPEVEERFRDDDGLTGVVVASPGLSPLLLTRTRLERQLVGRLGFGRALSQRQLVEAVSAPAAVLPADTGLQDAAAVLVGRPADRRWDDAVVELGGSWHLVAVHEVTAELARHHARRAETDPLTGLPNRVVLERWLRDRPGCGVVYIDLDGFKAVNDGLGHAVGDTVLRRYGEALRAALDPEVLVARIAGDEFALVAGDRDAAAAAAAVAVRVAATTSDVAELRGYRVGASAGVAVERPGEHPEQVLARADVAMYRAKQRGGTVAQHDPARDGNASALSRVTALQAALASGALHLHYQPVVRLATRRTVGVEALLRWTREDGTAVPPAEFVPLAERSGLIVPVTRLVLDRACMQGRLWLEEWGEEAPVVSVNLSPRSLLDDEVVRDVQRSLEVNDLPPHLLRLEVTETAAVDDLDRTAAVLGALRDLGCTVALDDFGTGQSSLAVLRGLPVDVLKVDRAFLRGVGRDEVATALVRHVVELARTLGLVVTAEGVEDAAQADALVAMGAELGQGWLFGRPVPPGELDLTPLSTPQAARVLIAPAVSLGGGRR